MRVFIALSTTSVHLVSPWLRKISVNLAVGTDPETDIDPTLFDNLCADAVEVTATCRGAGGLGLVHFNGL